MTGLSRESAAETDRLRAAYERRASVWARHAERWTAGNLFINQERERVALESLGSHGLLPIGDRRILDLGCGSGKALLGFLLHGARPDRLHGVDLRPERIEAARALHPQVDFRVADAVALPFEDGMFDLALAYTSLSAIVDGGRREAAAAEVRRVLRTGGYLLSYDFALNPVNRDVAPISVRELRRLFPGWTLDARRVTLAPPLARAVARRSWLACTALAAVPLLRTHRLVLVGPKQR